MQLSTNELEALVLRASHGVSPREIKAAQLAVKAIRAAKTTADLASTLSKFLANVTETSRVFVVPAAIERLSRLHLYGVANGYANAVVDTSSPIPRILVFEGLLQNLHYVIDLIKVLDRLQALRPTARFNFDGEDLPEAMAFSMAGFSILSDAMTNHRFPATVHDMLGPVARSDAKIAYRLASVFVLLHELGHIELGHVCRFH